MLLNIVAEGFWLTENRTPHGEGRHDVLRSLVQPFFSQRIVRQMEEVARRHCESRVRDIIQAAIAANNDVFNMADIAYPASLRTVCELLGFPQDAEDWVRREITAVARRQEFDLSPEPSEVRDYLMGIVARRRLQPPKDDLLGIIIRAWQEGKITERELLGYVGMFFSAASDTTGTNIVNKLALLSHFDLLDEARARMSTADEAWLRLAGEETTRFMPPFAFGATFTTQKVTLPSAFELEPFRPVRLSFAAANRDPAVYGETAKDFVVIERPNHLGYGLGVHHCIGAQLARHITLATFKTVLGMMPELELAPDGQFERSYTIVEVTDRADFRFNVLKAIELLGHG